MDIVMETPRLSISSEILRTVARIDEFKGAWKAFQNIAPDKLNLLRKVATIESVGSSNRNTIKAHLKALVQKRLLTQEGRGKGTSYRRPIGVAVRVGRTGAVQSDSDRVHHGTNDCRHVQAIVSGSSR